jgi:hypothetical protein
MNKLLIKNAIILLKVRMSNEKKNDETRYNMILMLYVEYYGTHSNYSKEKLVAISVHTPKDT